MLSLPGCGDPKPGGDVVIRWWQFWSDPYVKPVIRELIASFEKEHPGIRIEMTELTWSNGHEKIVTGFASGRAPDVLELGSDWVPEFAANAVLLDVTAQADSIRDAFYGWDPVRVEERVFGFPWLLGSRVLFYNKTLMQNANLAPDAPVNWSELLNAVRSIHRPESGVYGFGTTAKEPHQLYKKILPFFWQNGGTVLNTDWTTSNIDSPQNLKALKYYLQLSESGLLESQKMLDQQFIQGKIGFVISGGWLIRMLEDQSPSFEYGSCLMPRADDPDSMPYSFAGGEYLVINKKTPHKKEALQFVEFLTRPDNAMKICVTTRVTSPAAISANTDPFYENHPMDRVLFDQLAFSRMPPMHRNWIQIERVIEDEVELAVYKEKSPRRALQDAHKRINQLIQQ